jgi:hypothetical protein
VMWRHAHCGFICQYLYKSRQYMCNVTLSAFAWPLLKCKINKYYVLYRPQGLYPLLNGHLRSFLEVKRRWRGVYHTPPSVAGVRNEWSCASVSPVCLKGSRSDKFTSMITSRVWTWDGTAVSRYFRSRCSTSFMIFFIISYSYILSYSSGSVLYRCI